MNAYLQYGLYLVILVALAIPLGRYISRAMGGETVFLSPLLRPLERCFYRALHISPEEDMGWKKYAACALLFNLFGFVVLCLILMLQIGRAHV